MRIDSMTSPSHSSVQRIYIGGIEPPRLTVDIVLDRIRRQYSCIDANSGDPATRSLSHRNDPSHHHKEDRIKGDDNNHFKNDEYENSHCRPDENSPPRIEILEWDDTVQTKSIINRYTDDQRTFFFLTARVVTRTSTSHNSLKMKSKNKGQSSGIPSTDNHVPEKNSSKIKATITALDILMKQYHNVRWRGCTLKVELAKLHFLDRLRLERQSGEQVLHDPYPSQIKEIQGLQGEHTQKINQETESSATSRTSAKSNESIAPCNTATTTTATIKSETTCTASPRTAALPRILKIRKRYGVEAYWVDTKPITIDSSSINSTHTSRLTSSNKTRPTYNHDEILMRQKLELWSSLLQRQRQKRIKYVQKYNKNRQQILLVTQQKNKLIRSSQAHNNTMNLNPIDMSDGEKLEDSINKLTFLNRAVHLRFNDDITTIDTSLENDTQQTNFNQDEQVNHRRDQEHKKNTHDCDSVVSSHESYCSFPNHAHTSTLELSAPKVAQVQKDPALDKRVCSGRYVWSDEESDNNDESSKNSKENSHAQPFFKTTNSMDMTNFQFFEYKTGDDMGIKLLDFDEDIESNLRVLSSLYPDVDCDARNNKLSSKNMRTDPTSVIAANSSSSCKLQQNKCAISDNMSFSSMAGFMPRYDPNSSSAKTFEYTPYLPMLHNTMGEIITRSVQSNASSSTRIAISAELFVAVNYSSSTTTAGFIPRYDPNCLSAKTFERSPHAASPCNILERIPTSIHETSSKCENNLQNNAVHISKVNENPYLNGETKNESTNDSLIEEGNTEYHQTGKDRDNSNEDSDIPPVQKSSGKYIYEQSMLENIFQSMRHTNQEQFAFGFQSEAQFSVHESSTIKSDQLIPSVGFVETRPNDSNAFSGNDEQREGHVDTSLTQYPQQKELHTRTNDCNSLISTLHGIDDDKRFNHSVQERFFSQAMIDEYVKLFYSLNEGWNKATSRMSMIQGSEGTNIMQDGDEEKYKWMEERKILTSDWKRKRKYAVAKKKSKRTRRSK